MDDHKSVFFLIISFFCFWLVLDQYYGNKLISQFIAGLGGNSQPTISDTIQKDNEEKEEGMDAWEDLQNKVENNKEENKNPSGTGGGGFGGGGGGSW